MKVKINSTELNARVEYIIMIKITIYLKKKVKFLATNEGKLYKPFCHNKKP